MMQFTNFLQYNCSYLFLFVLLFSAIGHSTPVNPAEAAAIADLWYAMELNSGYLEITETEKAERFANMGNRQVFHMVSRDELLDAFPRERHVLAYIVKYIPNGFVVVSGDDRLEPLIVCSIESEFR